ncbi:DNA polymerase III subunit beta [Hazenella sp. IB182357]|uniref:Beta sliding clamp n=1 Tax=Polycladospora coralii TaxID=2771432 RepID=A0A926RWX6_9BACL|nr:DNA polymerase III subunit beta [Polycladospora coralii]MBD1371971.1 DNA polymerase III subunit beta [Polycladospora coralii]MBS7530475.1 DNA polymerase III subunit beta [Polycladospora coralii]
MQIRIQKSILVDAVSQVSKAVSQKTTIPILTGILCQATSEGLTLTGSNSDITIQVFISLKHDETDQVFIQQTGEVILPGKIFADIVRKLPGDTVEWVVGDQYQTTIRSKQAEFHLNGLPTQEFPRLPQLEEENVVSIATDTLNALIRQTGFAVSTSEARGVLTGVLIQLQEGILTCVATDSHRLSYQQAMVEVSNDVQLENVIVPGKSLAELAKTFHDQDEVVDIIVAENQMLVKTEHISFYSRLLEGTYPDTNRVIPKNGETHLLASTRDLLQSVDRASLMSRDGRDNVIKWTIKPNSIEVNSASQDIGSVSEEVAAQVEGNELSISFNARYMIDALRTIESDQVKIQFTGTMTPFLIQPVDTSDSLHVIVPIRTR